MYKHRHPLAVIAMGSFILAVAPQVQPHNSGGSHYTWFDMRGQKHYSDQITKAAIRNGYEVLNKQGIVVARIEGETTRKDPATSKRVTEQDDLDIKQRHDMELLHAYPDVATFKAMQHWMLKRADMQINNTQINIRTQKTALIALLKQAAYLQDCSKPIPATLSSHIDKVQATLIQQRTNFKHLKHKRALLAQHAAKQLQHFRKLKSRSKSMPD